MTAIAALVLCAGCSSKLSDADISTVLSENISPALKSVASIGVVQTDSSTNGDESLVKFKTQLKLTQPLFEATTLEALAKDTGSDVSLFGRIEESLQGAPAAMLAELGKDIENATLKPTFIVQTAVAGSAADWYGSFTAKKVVDKWVSSNFKTEVEPKLKGKPRAAFAAEAIEGINAKAWFTENRARQVAVLEKIEVAKKLAQKDVEIAQAKDAAAAEKQAKEALVAAQEKQARQMPVELSVRPALLGGTSVLVMQASRAMSVHLEVERGLQRFSRDYQLAPGRATQVGHVEGWGFKSGDAVRLTNPAFDVKAVSVP